MNLYSTADAARVLGITPATLRYHVQQGNIAGERIGNSLIFTEAELRRFQRRRRPPGNPQFGPKFWKARRRRAARKKGKG